MDVTATLDAPCPPGRLFAAVDDLASYPDWLEIVRRVRPVPGRDADEALAWDVELRGRLGPLARSKRLRMVRTRHDTPTRARFERRELDGRRHSPWVLDVVVTPDGDGSRLAMRLHYGGGFAGVVLERLLDDAIERSRPRLLSLVSDPAHAPADPPDDHPGPDRDEEPSWP
ncbi:MAG: SRPBCC family protein [Acidimicrobiales bacterium]|nr:SRPBCC family protein [Acidimicrobiales bacterium]